MQDTQRRKLAIEMITWINLDTFNPTHKYMKLAFCNNPQLIRNINIFDICSKTSKFLNIDSVSNISIVKLFSMKTCMHQGLY